MSKPRGNPNITKIGKRFSSENQPEHNGRPKNVFKQFHGLFECSRADVEAVLTELISKTADELTAIKNDKNTVAMRSILASALLKDKKNGYFYSIDFLISRLFGSVVQKVENSVKINTEDEKVSEALRKYGISKPKD